MNILIVSDVLGEENNGTTTAAMNLIRYLRSKGENVRILCADQEKKGQEGVFVVPHLYLGLIGKWALKKNNVSLSNPKKKIIKKALEGVDIVHAMFAFPLANKTTKIARKMGIPVTAGFHCQAENFTAHIGMMNNHFVNHLTYKIFYKKLYSKVNAIHYPTEFIQDLFEKDIKRKTNGYPISNGVGKEFQKINIIERKPELSGTINILFIGRISTEKSHPTLLKAVALSKYKDKIQLIFAGQGPKEKKVYRLAKRYKLRKPIMKFFSRPELVEIINSCDLYVHPSIAEIEAISCLEAIACGLVPVISDSERSATKKFALTEKNLFNHKSPKDLANKIDYWIEHPEEKAEYSEKYTGFTANFERNLCMEQMYSMIKTYGKSENHTPKKTYYYKDEINDDFANNDIKAAKIKENFKYIHTNPFYKFFAFVAYWIIAKPIVFCLNKIVYHQKIVNNLKVDKKSIKGGFIYANHVTDMGDAFTPNLIFGRRNNIITGPELYSLKGIRTFVSMIGAMPLPSTFKGSVKFLDAIKYKVQKGELIAIYPEAHIWPYYTKIRNFKDGSFKYPVDSNAPSICVTNTFVKKGKHVKLISYVDGPFYPDLSLGKIEARKKLRNEIYETMVKRSSQVEQFEKIKYININDIKD